jgi:hypothetical protein
MIMGYIPTRKYLKDDAIPTIFADSKPTKVRKNTEERKQKLEKKEVSKCLFYFIINQIIYFLVTDQFIIQE